MKKRLSVLDAFRGIAVLMVVLYHYTQRYYEIYPGSETFLFNFYNGKYGVQLFFIISGFVIYMSLARISSPLEFVKHRFIRLYPTFWFSVMLTFIIVSIFGLPNREVTFSTMLLNLTMISSQFGIPNVDGVYWTLIYELKFYFFIFLIFSFNSLNKIENIILVYLLLVLFISMFDVESSLSYKILNQILIFSFMNYFFAGIAFYKLFIGERTRKLYWIIFLSLCYGLYFNHYGHSYMILIIYFAFFLLSRHMLNFINIKPFIFFGYISYALYLVHQNIGYIILNYCYSMNISGIIATIVAIVITTLLALFITVYIEKPSMVYLKNKLDKNR